MHHLLTKQSTDQETEFGAYVGIDWANEKQLWSLEVAAIRKREKGEVEHSPEAVGEWINGLIVRFPGTAGSRLFRAIARSGAEYVV
jgi:hypothetical protein